ncbi:MAG: nicotinamide riboside transporter PnuC [Alphaproteobacteria bacterium]
MSTPEIIAVLLGLANVGLIIRRSIWNYPFGFAMVALYAVIFYDYRLYSDALLQVFFFVAQIFGLWHWLNGRADDGRIRVETLTLHWRLATVALTALGWLALGWLMATYTDAAVPYWDASVAAMSVTAQILLSMRRIENWLFWIVTDIDAIVLFWFKDLQLTAGLYAVFLCLAVVGLVSWLGARRAVPVPVR